MSRQHLAWGHLSISAISQLLLVRFGPNFKQRVQGTYTTDYNCQHDICPGNICPGDIFPYQQYKYFQAEHFRLQSCLGSSQMVGISWLWSFNCTVNQLPNKYVVSLVHISLNFLQTKFIGSWGKRWVFINISKGSEKKVRAEKSLTHRKSLTFFLSNCFPLI